MDSPHKLGGVSALIMAATFIAFAAVFGGLLMPAGYFEAGIDLVQKATIIVENKSVTSVAYTTGFVLFGVLLVVLVLTLHERLEFARPKEASIATVFGLIFAGLAIASGTVAFVGIRTVLDLYDSDPAQAGVIWGAIESVQLGLGAGNEIVGGLWILVVSWLAIKAGEFPNLMNYLGMLIGVVGLLVVVLPLVVVGPIFSLGLITWFVWVGIVLLRSHKSAAA